MAESLSDSLTEFDVRAFDRAIGETAALAINALVTASGQSYSQLTRSQSAGELGAEMSGVLKRAEATADLHIGRRTENDTLFQNVGAVALPARTPLAELVPYSSNIEELKLTDIDNETIAERNFQLDQLLRAVAEPFENAFLDKTTRRQRLQSATGKTEWQCEREGVTHAYNLSYGRTREGAELRTLICTTNPSGQRSSSTLRAGVSSEVSFNKGKVAEARVAWQEPGRSAATLPHKVLELQRLDGLIADLQGVNKHYYGITGFRINLAKRTIAIATGGGVTYNFDALKGESGTFVPDREEFKDMDPTVFAQFLELGLNTVPTSRVS